jgi:hypothetical protein
MNFDFILNTIGNDLNNVFYCNNYIKNTYCFDLDNIITGIQPILPMNVNYSNRTLIINNNDDTPVKNIIISTVDGKEIINHQFSEINNNSQIEIPIDLSSGLYFVNIYSFGKRYPRKLLVEE